MKENRKTVRVDAQGVCTVINNEKNIKGFLKDISISGVGFFSYDNYELNDDVKMEFALSGEEIKLTGKIVFKLAKENNMTRYGLEIEDISNEYYKLLNEYVTNEMKNIWSNKIKKYSYLK